jgi:hypothetical protein
MPTRFKDDDGLEYMVPVHLTSMFRTTVMSIRRPPLRCEKVGCHEAHEYG